MKKIKILLSVLSLFLFTSCNTQNNIKEYDYNTYDKDRILVKDFTLNDARECARGIKKYCYNVNCFAIDIFYYLDKTTTEVSFQSYVKGYIIMAREFDPLDKMHEYIDLTQSRKEEINNKIYSWNKKDFNDYDLIPIFVTYKTVYTLGEAYNLNYIDDNNLTNISDLYYNHLDECKVNIRFFSYNTF